MNRTSRAIIALCSAAFSLAACGDAGLDGIYDEEDVGQSERGGIGMDEQALVTRTVTVDPRRSLAVTDSAILSDFSLKAVLDQLAAQSGISGLTGTQLFKQLWDTQNPTASAKTTGPHCDTIAPLNGYPYGCRQAEGAQALSPEIEIEKYDAIGLFNRFDLAPATGEDCGEYRIVFAREADGTKRNLLIFEAVLANPHTSIEGCRPVANFWAQLSSNSDVTSRKNALVDFYFKGLKGFVPVIHFENLGTLGNGRSTTGQIRTNQFMQSPWTLREFKLQKSCGTSCSMLFQPVTDKTNPFSNLFAPNSSEALAAEFQNTFFPSQVGNLAKNNVNTFGYSVPDKFNTGESNAASTDLYVSKFNASSPLASNIQTQLNNIGSSLTPSNIVARAQALSCAGCHQLSNGQSLGGGLTWPSSLGFVHITERQTETGPDGPRFLISPALTGTFLPQRQAVLESYVSSPPIYSGVSVVGANRCLDISGGNSAPGGNVQIWPCNGTAAQRWHFTTSGELRGATGPNLCLETTNGGTANGTNIRTNTCNGSNAQKWTRTAAGELRSVLAPNMCIDVANGGTAAGTNVQLWTCNGLKNQRWFEQPTLGVHNPTNVPITIHAVRLAGQSGIWSNTFAGATPGQSISISVDYTISQMATCPGCIDQILIGIDSAAQGCVYNGTPSMTGTSGTGQMTLTAPSTPGVYYVRFRYGQAYSCDLNWWSVTNMPTDKDNIAVITVN